MMSRGTVDFWRVSYKLRKEELDRVARNITTNKEASALN